MGSRWDRAFLWPPTLQLFHISPVSFSAVQIYYAHWKTTGTGRLQCKRGYPDKRQWAERGKRITPSATYLHMETPHRLSAKGNQWKAVRKGVRQGKRDFCTNPQNKTNPNQPTNKTKTTTKEITIILWMTFLFLSIHMHPVEKQNMSSNSSVPGEELPCCPTCSILSDDLSLVTCRPNTQHWERWALTEWSMWDPQLQRHLHLRLTSAWPS